MAKWIGILMVVSCLGFGLLWADEESGSTPEQKPSEGVKKKGDHEKSRNNIRRRMEQRLRKEKERLKKEGLSDEEIEERLTAMRNRFREEQEKTRDMSPRDRMEYFQKKREEHMIDKWKEDGMKAEEIDQRLVELRKRHEQARVRSRNEYIEKTSMEMRKKLQEKGLSDEEIENRINTFKANVEKYHSRKKSEHEEGRPGKPGNQERRRFGRNDRESVESHQAKDRPGRKNKPVPENEEALRAELKGLQKEVAELSKLIRELKDAMDKDK